MTNTIITYITTPALSIILANYNSIMTAYNNLVNELTCGMTIDAYDMMTLTRNAYANKTIDQTYYTEYLDGTINTVTLLDDYLNDFYNNIYNTISSTAPILQQIDALENELNKINTYYSENPYFAFWSIELCPDTALDQMTCFTLTGLESILKNGIKVNGKINPAITMTTYVWYTEQTINGYTCVNVTQITQNSSNQVNFYMILSDQVNALLDEINGMISNLENLAIETNSDLTPVIQGLSTIPIVLDDQTYTLAQISEYIQSIEGTIS